MCRVFAQPVAESPESVAPQRRRGSLPLSGDDHLVQAQLYYQSLPPRLREQVRRDVQALYEEHARMVVGKGRTRAMEAPPEPSRYAGSCWDEVSVQPDERAPHGAFFNRVRVRRDDRPVLVPRAPGALQALSLAPRRQT